MNIYPFVDKDSYLEEAKKYKDFGDNLKLSIEALLKQSRIEYHDVNFRVKEYESFTEKAVRKNYESFKEVEDICGVRIICFYTDDLKKIEDIILREFNIVNSIKKEEGVQDDQFWYRSDHYVVSLKDAWIATPNYRQFGNFKAEIQVRTILMHAWAEIEWRLSYKKIGDAPKSLRRPLAQLSALLTLADDRFNVLRKDKTEYTTNIRKKFGENLNISSQLDIDTLQVFFSKYLLDYRKPSVGDLTKLLNQLRSTGVTLRNIVDGYKLLQDRIPVLKNDFEKATGHSMDNMTQAGITRLVLDITNESFYKMRYETMPEDLKNVLNKTRKEISA